MRMLSAHFSMAEAVVTSHRGFLAAQRAYFTPERERLFITYLAECWEHARTIVGRMQVVSAVRCPELNRAVGGSPTSHHMMTGLSAATDNVPLDMPLLQAYEALAASTVPFDEMIFEYGSWIHLGWRAVGRPERELLMKFHGTPYLVFNPKDPRLTAA